MRTLYPASLLLLSLLALNGCSSFFDPEQLAPEPCEEAACTPTGAPCHAGRISCPSRKCVDLGVPANDGAQCATRGTCREGTCVACEEGASCALGAQGTDAACRLGALVCSPTMSCRDTEALAPAGVGCGPDKVCDPAGKCLPCAAGAACTSPESQADPCGIYTTVCSSGGPVCTRTGTALGGSSCGAGKVCVGAECTNCEAGSTCQPAGTPCHQGTMSCDPYACADTGTLVPNGTSCGASQVCRDGGCVTCLAGGACTPPGQGRCFRGVWSCDTGSAVCVPTEEKLADGTGCGVDEVCHDGMCGACDHAATCTPGTDPCHVGSIACGTGLPVCEDTLANAALGTSCGTGQVCDASGACVACNAGEACTAANLCKEGQRTCLSNPPGACQEAGNRAPGTPCGTHLVCGAGFWAGTCGACTQDEVCAPTGTADVCRTGQRDCSGGYPGTCIATGNKGAGQSCGTNKVCDGGGTCVDCTSGATCTPGTPNACKNYVQACAAGYACVEETNKSAGTSCGTNQVCDGSGTCTPCTAGASCTLPDGHPSVCKTGQIVCSSGAPVCTATSTNRPNGSACGTDMVCNGGSCVGCVSDASCTPTNRCHAGTTSCASGTQTCTDLGTNLPAGTSCGTNQVCNASGTCGSCTPNLSCSTNPSSLCRTGLTSCSNGFPAVCVDSVPKSDGTSCGTNRVCDEGACVDCVSGVACTPANVCHVGATSCASGAPAVCADTGTPVGNGTTCGLDQVCTAGACVDCVAGVSCTSQPDPCQVGVTSCDQGAPATCANGGPDLSKEGLVCGASATGVCTDGTCACPGGQAFYQGDCYTCPAPATANTLYVDAGNGIDNPCCGRLTTNGFAGPCRTVTYALPLLPTGGTLYVRGDGQGNASASEVYPIRPTRGVTILGWSSTPRFPGRSGAPVFVIGDDTAQVWMGALIVGPNGDPGVQVRANGRLRTNVGALRIEGSTEPGSVALYVGPEAVIASPGQTFAVSGGATGVHFDGGKVDSGSLTVTGASTGVLCRSDSVQGSISGHPANFGSGTPGFTVSGCQRDIVASTGCSLAANLYLGGQACTSPLVEESNLLLESNAIVTNYAGHARCSRGDAVSLRPSATAPTNNPVLTWSGGIIEDNGCSGIYAEVGKVTVSNTTIRRNHWGIWQSSPLSSTNVNDALVSVTGGSITCNRHTTIGACAASGAGADVWNQSGLPLPTSNVAWDVAPLAKCACDHLLQGCACSGRAFGQTSPPDAIEVLTSRFDANTTGTPTVDTTSYAVSGSGCPTP